MIKDKTLSKRTKNKTKRKNLFSKEDGTFKSYKSEDLLRYVCHTYRFNLRQLSLNWYVSR